MLEFFRRLYVKEKSWFGIKYAGQILFVLVFGLLSYYGSPSYEGTTDAEKHEVNVSPPLSYRYRSPTVSEDSPLSAAFSSLIVFFGHMWDRLRCHMKDFGGQWQRWQRFIYWP